MFDNPTGKERTVSTGWVLKAADVEKLLRARVDPSLFCFGIDFINFGICVGYNTTDFASKASPIS